MKTDPERRAELLAKLAKLDAREQNRNARKASKDVRRMEADLRVVEKLIGVYEAAEELGMVRTSLTNLLKAARAAAVPQ